METLRVCSYCEIPCMTGKSCQHSRKTFRNVRWFFDRNSPPDKRTPSSSPVKKADALSNCHEPGILRFSDLWFSVRQVSRSGATG